MPAPYDPQTRAYAPCPPLPAHHHSEAYQLDHVTRGGPSRSPPNGNSHTKMAHGCPVSGHSGGAGLCPVLSNTSSFGKPATTFFFPGKEEEAKPKEKEDAKQEVAPVAAPKDTTKEAEPPPKVTS